MKTDDEERHDTDVFWERAEALLEEHGVNPSEISVFSFMSRNAYANAKGARSAPGIDFVDGMARRLNVSVDYMVTGIGEGRPYIDDDVPMPANPDQPFARAKVLAREFKLRPEAVLLVLSQNPDPRLGAAQIYTLIARADRMLAGLEARDEKSAKKKRPRAKRATPSSR